MNVASEEGALFSGLAFAAVACLIPAGIAVRYARRVRLIAGPDGLLVVNVFKERRLGWSEIESAIPGYHGISIQLHDGTTVVAGAVQKANLTEWLGRRTRADVVAECINERAAGADESPI